MVSRPSRMQEQRDIQSTPKGAAVMFTPARGTLILIAAAIVGAWAPRLAAADGARQLFTVSFPREGANVLVPVRLTHRLGESPLSLQQIDLSGRSLGAFPVVSAGPGEAIAVLPAGPGGRRVFWLTAAPVPAGGAGGVRLAGMTVTAHAYVAHFSPDRGGIMDALRVTAPDGAPVEVLGAGGVQWNWTGTPGRSSQPACGACPVRVLESGPARCVVETTAANVCAPGDAFTVTTTLYPDCIDQHYQYHHTALFQTSALKLWCFLSPKGYHPGYRIGQTTPKTALLKAGNPTWTQDPLYVDLTFDDPASFGLGFIGLQGCKRIYVNDVAGSAQEHNLFVDATGYNGKMQDVTGDVDEWIRLVPHLGGPEGWAATRALAIAPRVVALGVQAPGGPLPDSDNDGLDDLAELRLGTNPLVADTAGDGIPDGRNPHPLQHVNPAAAISPAPPGPLAPPVAAACPQPTARIETIGGRPMIVVNGKPFGPMTYTLPGDYTLDYLKPFAQADMRIFSVYTDGGFSNPGAQGMAHLDQQMKVILAANPSAYVIVRPMYIETPEAWAKAHPDDLLTSADGSTLMKDSRAAKDGKPHYTFASEVWKRDVGEALRRLIDHVRQSPYGGRVIGYFIGAGYPTEEWIYAQWGPDYSPAMKDAFRRFLIRRYHGSVVALRAAWQDEEADFATAGVPSEEEWTGTTSGDLWDPAQGCKVADYLRCHNETEAEKVEYLSRVVKAATGGKALCGFWYLNLACISHHFSGHQALEKMLSCPTVDLFGAPPPYENRDLDSDCPLRSVVESVNLHGKMWYVNQDTRTHFADHENDQYGRPPDMAGSLSNLTRDFASLLLRGAQGEWYEMGNWYHDPQILDRMRRLQLIGRLQPAYSAPLHSGLAVVVDEDSLFRSSRELGYELLERLRTNELSRLGVPTEFYFLGDLARPDMPQFRCYLFLNAFSLDAKRRALLKRVTERQGTTAIWLYAPGVLDPGDPAGAAEARMAALTGIKLRLKPERHTLAMRPVAGHPLVAGLPPDRTLGQWDFKIRCTFGVYPDKPQDPGPVAHCPTVYADDAQAAPLARYADGGEVGYCAKRMGGHTSVFFGSPAISGDLLRRILKWSGVHVYDDSTDVDYVSASLLCVHALHDAPQVVRFPRPVDVYDLIADREVARDVTEVNLNLRRLDTGLYWYGKLSEFSPEWARAKREQAAEVG